MKKQKIIVVMPAYYAEKTLEKTLQDIPKNFVSEIILVDDASRDKTIKIAKKLGLTVFSHKYNLGYGGNQKTCYWEALKKKPAVIVMLHPDYQYDGRLLPELVKPIVEGRFDIMFGNRIRTRKEALAGGMPALKYFLNRILTTVENIILGINLSETLSGFRAYSYKSLLKLPFQRFSNDFVFDQQLMISAVSSGFQIGETSVPVRYFSEASSIGLLKGAKFLIQTAWTLFLYLLYSLGIYRSPIFKQR